MQEQYFYAFWIFTYLYKKMTHVLLISSSNPVNKDGSAAAGSFVHDFANELSKFINITIVTPGNDDSIIKLDNGAFVSCQRGRIE